MIEDERYIDIANKIALCQAQNKACVLIYVESGYDDDGDQCDTMSWRTATHSVYETYGMAERFRQSLAPIPIYDANGDDK